MNFKKQTIYLFSKLFILLSLAVSGSVYAACTVSGVAIYKQENQNNHKVKMGLMQPDILK